MCCTPNCLLPACGAIWECDCDPSGWMWTSSHLGSLVWWSSQRRQSQQCISVVWRPFPSCLHRLLKSCSRFLTTLWKQQNRLSCANRTTQRVQNSSICWLLDTSCPQDKNRPFDTCCGRSASGADYTKLKNDPAEFILSCTSWQGCSVQQSTP